MQVKMTKDGSAVVPVMAKRMPEHRKLGRKRRGYQAADLLKAMTDPDEADKQEPNVDLPRMMVESFRIEGRDDVTARDHALYLGLMAHARFHGMQQEKHVVPAADLLRFLKVRPGEDEEGRRPRAKAMRSIDRLVESLQRIARTTVSYDLRIDGGRRRRAVFPLVIFETEEFEAGSDTVAFSFPFPIRQTILTSWDSLSYAKLELDAFPKFRSRYTPRLYSRLALRAGYSVPEPWTVSVKELASALGWPMGSWHYPSFRRDCLRPVLADVAAHVRRFKVEVEETTGTGRGRPVESLTFRFTDIRKPLAEAKRSALFLSVTNKAYKAIAASDAVHPPEDMPEVNDVLRGAGMVGRTPVEVALGWRHALDMAKAAGAQHEGILALLKDKGVRPAFEAWLNALPFGMHIPIRVESVPLRCPPARTSRNGLPRATAQRSASADAEVAVPFRALADWVIPEPEQRDPLDDLEDFDDCEPPTWTSTEPTGASDEDIPY